MSDKLCKVSECRYSNTHVTGGHKCGKCEKYGHGIIECYSQYKINQLLRFCNDIMPVELQCRVENCIYYEYHSIDAHNCKICKKRDSHSERNCPLKIFKINCPICRTENTIKNDGKKIYGLSDKCSICFENNVNILFPECCHVCICKECLDNMK